MMWFLYAGLVWGPAIAGINIAVMVALVLTVPLDQPWPVVSLMLLILAGTAMVALAVRSHMRATLWDHIWFSAALMVICSVGAVWELATAETEFPLASIYLTLAFAATSNLILWCAESFTRSWKKAASVRSEPIQAETDLA
jgi:hypothetical protein